MKQIKSSQRLLSLLVGSLLAMQSGAVFANDDDELLMFVESSKPAVPKPVAKATTPSVSQMAGVFSQQAKSEVSKPVAGGSQSPSLVTPVKPLVTPTQSLVTPTPSLVTPTPSLVTPTQSLVTATPPAVTANPVQRVENKPVFSSGPLLQNPETTLSATPDKPVVTSGTQTPSFAPSPQSIVSTAGGELPVFKPESSLSTPVVSQPQFAEPVLTPTPTLYTASAPQTVSRVSPGEMQLRAIFYRAVMTALERSPQMRSTKLQSDAAKEDVSNAKGQRWPQVDVSSNSRRYEFGKGNRNGADSNLPSFGMSVATNLVDFGQTSNTIKSKEFSVQAANYLNSAQAEDLAWKVSSGMVELSKQRLIIEMSKQYVARMQELVTMLSGIVAADQGRRSELTQAKGRFLQAQSALDNAVSKARDTEIQLYRLIGETQVPIPDATEWQLQPSQLTVLLAQIDKHPTLLQATAQSGAAFAEADALKSSALPKINWVVSKDTGKDFEGREQSWQTGINVSWGLFRGGSSRAAELAAVQRASAIREQADDQRDDLEQRIRAADQDAHSMLQRADLYRNLTKESDRIRVDFFDQWYHLGKRTLLDVLSAESDYYNNRVAEVTNRFDGYSAIFRGYASAGQLMNWLNNASSAR